MILAAIHIEKNDGTNFSLTQLNIYNQNNRSTTLLNQDA